MSTATKKKPRPKLSDGTWSAINAALTEPQRRAFNRWHSRVDTLAGDILNDVSFFQMWIDTRRERGEPNVRGLMPQTPGQADELVKLLREIPWLEGR
jgi:hypothetical protein